MRRPHVQWSQLFGFAFLCGLGSAMCLLVGMLGIPNGPLRSPLPYGVLQSSEILSIPVSQAILRQP